MRVRKAFGFVGAGWGVLRAHACCLDLGMCVHETRECCVWTVLRPQWTSGGWSDRSPAHRGGQKPKHEKNVNI